MPGWPPGCGRVLAGALGLQGVGVEYAVAAERAFRQCLRIVLERVRRRLGALVLHLQSRAAGRLGRVAFKLVQHKRDVGAVLLDGPGCTKPSTRRLLW